MTNFKAFTTRAFFALALLTSTSFAEDVTSTAEVAAPSTAKVMGEIDLRPSVKTKGSTLHTEDTFELGYQFSPGRIVSVVQYLETNLSNPDADGLGLTVYDTFLRTRIGKILEDKDLGLSLSFQNRTYLPVTSASRDRGMIATFRNYITLTKKVSDTLSVSLAELPIFPVYTVDAAGGKANPLYENRVYLIPSIQISEKMSLDIPLLFYTTFMRESAGAENSAKTIFTLITYPEISYAIAENMNLGLAYYSNNLLKADLSGTNLGEGLGDGVVQLVLGASL